MPPHAMRSAAIMLPLCPVVRPVVVPCQYGLVRRAGESITHEAAESS